MLVCTLMGSPDTLCALCEHDESQGAFHRVPAKNKVYQKRCPHLEPVCGRLAVSVCSVTDVHYYRCSAGHVWHSPP